MWKITLNPIPTRQIIKSRFEIEDDMCLLCNGVWSLKTNVHLFM